MCDSSDESLYCQLPAIILLFKHVWNRLQMWIVSCIHLWNCLYYIKSFADTWYKELNFHIFIFTFLGQDLYNEKTLPMLEKMVDTGEVIRKAVTDDEWVYAYNLLFYCSSWYILLQPPWHNSVLRKCDFSPNDITSHWNWYGG